MRKNNFIVLLYNKIVKTNQTNRTLISMDDDNVIRYSSKRRVVCIKFQ